MNKKIQNKMNSLFKLDNDIENALYYCLNVKKKIENIFEYDTRYCGASWTVIKSRENRFSDMINECINDKILNCQTDKLDKLIHIDMNLESLLKFDDIMGLNTDVLHFSVGDTFDQSGFVNAFDSSKGMIMILNEYKQESPVNSEIINIYA